MPTDVLARLLREVFGAFGIKLIGDRNSVPLPIGDGLNIDKVLACDEISAIDQIRNRRIVK